MRVGAGRFRSDFPSLLLRIVNRNPLLLHVGKTNRRGSVSVAVRSKKTPP